MNDSQDKPRKILLGKKVIRHFAVRTGIQTGAKASADNTVATTDDSSVVADPSKDTSAVTNTSTGTGCNNTRMSYDGGGGGVATNARC